MSFNTVTQQVDLKPFKEKYDKLSPEFIGAFTAFATGLAVIRRRLINRPIPGNIDQEFVNRIDGFIYGDWVGKGKIEEAAELSKFVFFCKETERPAPLLDLCTDFFIAMMKELQKSLSSETENLLLLSAMTASEAVIFMDELNEEDTAALIFEADRQRKEAQY